MEDHESAFSDVIDLTEDLSDTQYGTQPTNHTRKRARIIPQSTDTVNVDDEEDISTIVARINAFEEKEKLARQSGNSSFDATSSSLFHDDEAYARQLAEQEGYNLIDETHTSTSGHNVLSSTNTSSQKPPDEQLKQFRDVFTKERACTHCGEPTLHPRGYVRLNSHSHRDLF